MAKLSKMYTYIKAKTRRNILIEYAACGLKIQTYIEADYQNASNYLDRSGIEFYTFDPNVG